MKELTPLQRTLRNHMDAVEIIGDRQHNQPVQLADWLSVLMYDYGVAEVVSAATELAHEAAV